MGRRRTPAKSFAKKLWHFIESPLFLVGVGIVLTVIATKISLVIAWVCIVAAIHRSEFFENRSNAKKRLGVAVLSIVTAFALMGIWWWIKPIEGVADMQIVDQQFPNGTQLPFQPGQKIEVGLRIENRGNATAHNVHYHTNIGFVNVYTPVEEMDRQIDDLFKAVYRQINTFVERGESGSVVVVRNPREEWIPAFLNSPSDTDIRDLLQDKKALCIIARIEFDNTHWYERCLIFAREDLQITQRTGTPRWHSCSSHNKSGVHLPGSVL